MANRLRVLHVEVGGSWGGSSRALELYLRYADRRQFDHVVLLYYPTPHSEAFFQAAGNLQVMRDDTPPAPGDSIVRRTPVQRAIGRAARMWQHLLIMRQLCSFMTRERFDVIHVNNTFEYQPATILAGKLTGTRVVAHVRNPVSDSPGVRWLGRQCAAIVAVSESYRAEMAKLDLRRNVIACYDGVEISDCDMTVAKTIRGELAGRDEVLIGSVGRLDEQKGYDVLIQAAEIVLRTEPRIRFAILGDGPQRLQLERLIAARELGSRIKLCGFRSDVANFLAALDIFVSSSRWEGLPIAVIEAMMMKRPVVATAVGGVAEAVVPGETGYLAFPESADALAGALIGALHANNEDRERMVAQAHRKAMALTDPRLAASGLDSILRATAESAVCRAGKKDQPDVACG